MQDISEVQKTANMANMLLMQFVRCFDKHQFYATAAVYLI